MREFKFRNWCVLGGKGSFIYFTLEDAGEYNWDIFDEYVITNQFTGLLDKNGEEIYEGDILELTDGGYVEFDLRLLQFGINIPGARWFGLSELLEWHIRSVVGNIYENPKLLNTTVQSDHEPVLS